MIVKGIRKKGSVGRGRKRFRGRKEGKEGDKGGRKEKAKKRRWRECAKK